MPITLPDDQVLRLVQHFLTPCSGHHPTSGSGPVHLSTILQEIRAMSQTTTQAATDAAQVRADLQAVRLKIDTLTQQISDLQATAAANAGSVPAELQAAIDELHQFAQGGAQQPASGGDTTGGGTGGDQPAPTPDQPAPDQPAPAGDQPAPSGDQPAPGTDTGGATASDPNAPQGGELTPEPEA